MKLLSLFALSILLLVTGCVHTSVATDNPDFLAMRGEKFALSIDAYVYEELQDRHPLPLIGFPPFGQGLGSPRFPKNPREWIGKRYGSIRILDFIPQGTTFTVVQHRIRRNPTMGTFNHLIVRLDGPLGERWPMLDAYSLTPQLEDRIRFYPDLVEKL